MQEQQSILKFETYLVEVRRKRMKNLILKLLPGGKLRVSCPYRTSDAQILSFLESRKDWIHQQKFPEPEPVYRDGAVIPCFGEKLVVNARHGSGQTIREGRQLHLHVTDPTDPKLIEKKVKDYFRQELYAYLELRIPFWAEKMSLKPADFRIRQMKSRWGSCDVRNKNLTFSLMLVHKPTLCTDLVIVHELAHLIEANHSPHFYAILDETLPGWKAIQSLLS